MHRHLPRFRLTPLHAALLIQAGWVSADPVQKTEVVLPRVNVIGGGEALTHITGAGYVLDSKQLEQSHVFTVNEALRRVPGVNMRDEEGFGLRPNIGIRGLNPTRSTKITLLEDGIPLAYAPYGDNASYYHPMIDRYERIEVLKGAGALLFGPQTIGGVINYITPTPPRQPGGSVQVTAGNRDYLNATISAGGNGFLFDYTRKQGDGARDNMDHELDDVSLQYVMELSDNQALRLRASYYTEDSTLTYSGLTEAEYENLGEDYNPFKNDRFDADRTGLSATHEFDLGKDAALVTNVYWSEFNRDWWRQASNSQDGQCGGAFNAARLAGTAVNPDTCNSVQGRLRSYENWGVEPRLTLPHAWGELQAGAKAHFEEQDRRQINGTSPTARSGTLAENNLRETDAYALFVANRFDFGNVSITPIVRQEWIEVERTNRLTGATGSTDINETMPGIGATWNPSAALTVFTSVHKGFAPPRVEDLIGGTGTVVDVDAEESTNFELGLRAEPMAGFAVQAAYFHADFDNLIAVGSIAGGSTPLSQGEALFEGVEIDAKGAWANGLFGRAALTWLPEAEQTSAFRNVATGATVGVEGRRQPYTPEHTLTAALGYEKGAFNAEIEAQYVDEQYSDFANTAAPTADGQRGEIDAYTVVNAAVNYRFDPAWSGFVTVKNLADRTYIVDRTRGIQVGMPRLVQAGVKYMF